MKRILVVLTAAILLVAFPQTIFGYSYWEEDLTAQAEPEFVNDCAAAACPTFVENFDKKKLKKHIWDVFENGGALAFDGNFVTLNAASAMPYVSTVDNPIPESGPFSVEFGIQYLTAGDEGAGVGISLNKQPNDSTDFWANTPMAFWQTSTGLFVVRGGVPLQITSGPDLSYRVVRFSYDGTSYRVSVDGSPYPFTFTAPRVTNLWFGHPDFCCPASWSDFKLDYVKVTPN